MCDALPTPFVVTPPPPKGEAAALLADVAKLAVWNPLFPCSILAELDTLTILVSRVYNSCIAGLQFLYRGFLL